jgi:hypothetical protein
MKYLKNFKELINERVNPFQQNRNLGNNQSSLKSTISNIFKIFKVKDALSEIWDEEMVQIASNVHDSFIDIQELSALSRDEVQMFADNLGVGQEENLLVSILEQLYNEKYKRSFKKDIKLCIDNLKDFIKNETDLEVTNLPNRYLIELEKIYKNL